MSTTDYMKGIVVRFTTILNAHEDHMRLFDQYHVQVEGWFKGELMAFFESERASNRLSAFSPECPFGDGKKRVDYQLQLPDSTTRTVWIELKHFQIGPVPNGQNWKASTYLGAGASYGIHDDVDKLTHIPDGDKFLLVLATKNPGDDDWQEGLSEFSRKFPSLGVISHTRPSNSIFRSTSFLGLLEVATPPPPAA